MNFIERYKAFIITSLLMGIVVLSLYNITMVQQQQGYSEMLIEIPADLLEEEEEAEEQEEDPTLQKQRDLIAARRTHDAFNEDFEDPEDDTAFEERLKALMGATETAADGTERSSESKDTEENETDGKEEKSTKQSTPLKDTESNNRNASLSYRLKDRKALELPNPIYTCQRSGKVVVKIEVNENGYVVGTEINKKASTTRNECLFDNAIEYARSALFARSERKQQLGTITYFFNYAD